MLAEEGQILLRWGILPPNVVIEPTLMDGHPEQTWVLDIDTFSNATHPYQHRLLTDLFTALAHRSYAVFRYVVTDEFLRFFGGLS